MTAQRLRFIGAAASQSSLSGELPLIPKSALFRQNQGGRVEERGRISGKDGLDYLAVPCLTCSPNCLVTAIPGPKGVLGTLELLCI